MAQRLDKVTIKTPEQTIEIPLHASVDAQTPRSGGAVEALTVGGYKSIADEQRVEIRPLTILAGANSSGKSSIVQPLLLLKQTLDATYDPGPLLLDGPNVKFTSSDQFFSRCRTETPDQFSVAVELGGKRSLKPLFQRKPGLGVELVSTRFTWAQGERELRPELSREELLSAMADMWDVLVGYKLPAFAKPALQLLQWLASQQTFGVRRNRCFFDFSGEENRKLVASSDAFFWMDFVAAVRKVIHVSAHRGKQERTYRTTAVGSTFLGTFETYVASVVRDWKLKADDSLEALNVALQALGLAHGIDARPVDETQVELRVGLLPAGKRRSAKESVSVADVGFGVSQVLPVLVAVIAAAPGQLVYIEEPEIHLHPRAQVALAEVLARAAQRGVRVVIETHSQLLLLGIQTLVAEGKLAPELVKLHWFQRRSDGTTQITSADLDEDGAFGDWPEDFADVALKAESKYLDAAMVAEAR